MVFHIPGALRAGGVNVAALYQTYQLTQETLSRMTGYSLRTVADWRTNKPLKPTTAQRIVEILRLCDALGKVVSPKTIGHWMRIPNDAFDGSTPLQVIERGEADRQCMIHLIARAGFEHLQRMGVDLALQAMRSERACRNGKRAVDCGDEKPDIHAQPQPP